MKFFYKLFSLGALLFCLQSRPYAQTSMQSATFAAIRQDTSVNLSVFGKLDFKNNTNGRVNYMYNLCQSYIPAFGPLQSLTVTNNGLSPLDSIRVISNGAGNWQTLSSMATEAQGNSRNKKDMALRLWKFISDNRYMYNSPEPFGNSEMINPLKMMIDYGYGNSFTAANAYMNLNAAYSSDSLWLWDIGGDHIVTEARRDSGTALIDPSWGGFYLKLNNQDLASFDDIMFNKYIFLRTKHFGPAYPFNSPLNFRLIQDYQSPASHKIAFGAFNSSTAVVPSLMLRGGEAITISNTTPSVVHHIPNAVPDSSNVKNIIGSGSIVFKPDFKRISFDQISMSYNNIRIDSTTSTPVVCPTYNPGFFIIKMASPFVITNGSVVVDWNTGTNDMLTIEYSTNLTDWAVIATKSLPGRSVDSISLENNIGPASNPAVYTYYLRFKMTSQQFYSCTVNMLKLESDFQVSKFFVPQLQLGSNTLRITSGYSANKNLRVDVNWLENSSNTPPLPIASPSFPGDGSTVDSTQFTFRWPAAVDPNNDSIVDYHFQLSDQPDIPYPLSPNFDRYLSASGSSVSPQFLSEIQNFLNPGTRYYWHVRALDSRGAWSNWSPSWSFVPQGPKRAVALDYTVGSDSLVTITWHTAAAGKQPVKYYVHASTDRGFYPTNATRIATVTDSSYKVPLPASYLYYLIISADELENQSAPSDFIAIPPPILVREQDNYRANKALVDTGNYGYHLKYSIDDTSKAIIVNNGIVAKRKGSAYLTTLYSNDYGQTIYYEKRLMNITMNYRDSSTQLTGITKDTVINLNVGGLLDGTNSISKFISYEFDLYNYYVPQFGPLKNFTISNNGVAQVDSISLYMNNDAAWSDLPSLAKEVGKNANTSKKKAMSIWSYVGRKHYYYYPPEPFDSPEIEDPIKFLGTYGYGNCFMISNAVKFINTQITGDSLWIWGLSDGDHGVAECLIDSNYAIIDADRAAFYLKMDNKQYASYEDIIFDKYLLLRTQHFGPAFPYRSDLNFYLIDDYTGGNNYRSLFTEYGTDVPTATTYFSLRGGENVEFSNSSPPIVHYTDNTVPDSTNVMNIVGSGKLAFAPNLNKIPFNNISMNFNNIQVDSSSGKAIIRPSWGTGAYFIVKMRMPFVFVGGKVVMDWACGTNDNIVVEYSPDLYSWKTVATKSGGGASNDTLNLGSSIAPTSNDATYDFYLRFSLKPGDPNVLYACLINSFNIIGDFQISKLYIPQLVVGNNTIQLKSANSSTNKNLAFNIAWTENNRNTPPNPVTVPIFPANAASVDSTQFTFRWTPATDPDGDTIQDYHFQVSEDPSMLYPVSPNFDRYISATDSTAQARFLPEVDNFLQPGKTYYWRVRALDARGAWSTWSNVWSFTPKGARYVTNVDYTAIPNTKQVQLKWNTGTVGNRPVKYYVHGTDERGFFPTDATVIATVTDSSYTFTLASDSSQFFRIIAEDSLGNQSPPTDCYTIPAPVHVPVTNTTTVLSKTFDGDYPLGYVVADTSIAILSGYNVKPRKVGFTYLYNNFYNDQGRIVHKEKQLLFIDSVANSSLSTMASTKVAMIPGKDTSSLTAADFTFLTASKPAGNSDFSLYPNPANDQIFVSTATDNKASRLYYRVTGMNGKQVRSGVIDSSNYPVNLSGCPSGTYIFTIYNAQGLKLSKQFIITVR